MQSFFSSALPNLQPTSNKDVVADSMPSSSLTSSLDLLYFPSAMLFPHSFIIYLAEVIILLASQIFFLSRLYFLEQL